MDTKFSQKVKAMAKLKIIIFLLLIDLHITTSQNFNINLTSLPKVCGIGPSSRGQSLGFRFVAKGSDAEIHDYPWMVSIGLFEGQDDYTHKCGGSVISSKFVLTAAHCFDDNKFQDMTMLFGVDNLNNRRTQDYIERQIQQIFVHEGYKSPQSYFDVALAEADLEIDFALTVWPICLPEFASSDLNLRVNHGVTLSGWGSMTKLGKVSAKLQHSGLIVEHQTLCNKSYDTINSANPLSLEIEMAIPDLFQPDLLCAGSAEFGSGSCSGDSGGPLFFKDKSATPFRHVQVGIVQGGAGECGNEKFPGLFARLDNHDVLNFIYKTAFGKTISARSLLLDDEKYPEYEYPEYPEYGTCTTIRGPRPNKPCVFPFTFNGERKSTCIKGRRRPEPWCSTKVDNGNNYIRGEWGYCGDCLDLDPIDCQWSSWSQFQDCSKSCGTGSQFFQRGQRVKSANGGKDCVGNYIKAEECNSQPCSVDCIWSSWSDWTSCSKTCGGGVSERSRRVQTPAQNGGSKCQGLQRQTRRCNEQDCLGDEYYVHVEPKTHAEAIRVCKRLGRQLFEPRNFSTKSKVIALAKTKGVTRFWIGIHDITNEGNFTYDSDGQKISYKNWFPNEPNNIGSGEDCVEIMGGNWNDLSCNAKRSFVCENTQLAEYDVHVEQKSHAEAIRACKRLGRKLFEPRDFSVNSEVLALAKSKGVTRFWIGIHDITNEGNFTYDSNGQTISYMNWFLNEPNNVGIGEDCAEAMVGNWNDLSCKGKRPFVCEKTQKTSSRLVETFREEYDDYYDEVDEICRTDSGSQVNKKCKFPFIFRGTTYDTCISGSRRRQPWCSTQLDANGAYVSGKWGYCDTNLCQNRLSPESSFTNSFSVKKQPLKIVDCAWSSWSDWTSCSKACGRGVGERSRRVQTPAQNGGSQCQGVSTQTRICNEQNCPVSVNCRWSSWSDWTACSKTCGNRIRERSRRVETLAQNGGSQCLGSTRQTTTCNDQNCPGCATSCCSRIQVTLYENVRKSQGVFAGTYQKACGMKNNRNYWTQSEGAGGALWIVRYPGSNDWDWAIGSENDLGTSRVSIFSSHETANPAACPTSVNRFQYVKKGQFLSAPANSIFIQCA